MWRAMRHRPVAPCGPSAAFCFIIGRFAMSREACLVCWCNHVCASTAPDTSFCSPCCLQRRNVYPRCRRPVAIGMVCAVARHPRQGGMAAVAVRARQRKPLRYKYYPNYLHECQKRRIFAIRNKNKIIIHYYETIKQTFCAQERYARKGNPIW